MITKLNLDQLLEPFKDNVKATLALPSDIQDNDFINLLKQFLNSDPIDLRVHHAPIVSHLPSQLELVAIKADPLDSPFFVGVSSPAKAKIFDLFFGSMEPFSDPRLVHGALCYLVLSFTSLLNQQKLFSKLAFYVTDKPHALDSYHHLKAELVIEGAYPVIVDLFFPEAFVESFCEIYKDKIQEPQHVLPLPISVISGSVRLSYAELKSLKETDVIFLDENYYDTDTHKGITKLSLSGKTFAQARLHHQHLKFLEFNYDAQPTQIDMNSENTMTPLPDVNLELQVEFASFKMSSKDLESLTVGQTIELHKDDPTCVFLCLDGQKIAKGQLVKVGEKMAVMIEELSHV